MGKDTSVIPQGSYCYRLLKVEQRKDGMPILRTKPCPYFKHREYGGVGTVYCEFLDLESLSESVTDAEYNKLIEHFGSEDALYDRFPSSLLWDQCKECGINEESEDEDVG